MDLEVSPTPTEDELAAIGAALERALPPPDAHPERGPWWRAGIAENVKEPDGLSERPSG